MLIPSTTFATLRRALLLAFLPLSLVFAHAAEAAKISFDLPAGEASRTLKQFATQAKREIMFPSQQVDSVKTNAVAGSFTVREGLDRLLANTDLKVFEDAKTGALIVQPRNDPNDPRTAPTANSDRPESAKDGAGTVEGSVVMAGDAVAQARISVAGLSGFTLTDRNGQFVLTAVPVGPHDLLISGENIALTRVTGLLVRDRLKTTLATITVQPRRDDLLSQREVVVPAAKLSEIFELERMAVVSRKPAPFTGANVDLPRTQDDAQPYFIYDSVQIERSGAASMADFLQKFAPMNFTKRQPESDPALLNGTTTLVSLFGSSGSSQTLILINGRRVPGIYLAGNSSQPDLNGIPMTSIDRIEILPASAAAIYGGTALGGVINVVLKRNYVGGELRGTYENTFDTDASQQTASLTAGMTLEGGKTHVLFSLTTSERNPLQIQDRDYLVDYTTQASIARFGRNAPGVPWYGATPNVTTGNPASFLTLKAAYGGTSLGSSITYVPVGYNGVAASGVAGLVANAGAYNYGTPATRYSSSVQGIGANYPITQRAKMEGMNFTIRRRMLSWLELFGTHYRNENQGFAGAVVADSVGGSNGLITLPAAAPTNPFTTAVAIFAPINSGFEDTRSQSLSQQFVVGAQIDLPKEWKAQLEYNYGDNRFSYRSNPLYLAGLNADLLSGVFDPLRDLIAAGATTLKYRGLTDYEGNSVVETFSGRAAGPVWTLPGGDITASTSLGQTESGNKRSRLVTTYEFYPTANASTVYPNNLSTTRYGHLEMTLPVFGGKFRWPLLEKLDFQVAGRIDDYKSTQASSFAGTATGSASTSNSRRRTHNETSGVRWSPVKDVMFRASYSTAFTPPVPSQLLPSTSTPSTTTVIDPRRGNTSTLTQTLGGGNPDLGPETSENVNIGVIVTPRWLKQLRLSADYSRITRNNTISTLGAQALVNLESVYPDRITRAAASTDASYGVGAITFVNTSSLNLLMTQMESYNYNADYTLKTTHWGNWTFGGRAAVIQHYRYQTAFGQPLIEAIGNENQTTFGLIAKFKGNVSLTWDRGPWTLGWTTRYTGHYVQALTFQAAQGSRYVPEQSYHDFYSEYRFRRATRSSGAIWRRMLDNTTLQLGVKNVLNTKPPIDVSGAGLGYSYYGDYRLASYWLGLKKNF